jgi:hypothetical protein
MEIGVKAGALPGFAEMAVKAGALPGFAENPPKTKERTIILNDKMCLSIQASLAHREFFRADPDNII